MATAAQVEEELAERRKTIKCRLGGDEEDSLASLETNFEEYEEAVKRSIKTNHLPDEEPKEPMIKIYDPEYSRNTEFFSSYPPEALLGAILNHFSDKKIDEKLSPNKFKVVLSLTSEQGSIVSFSAEIQKVLPKGAARDHLVEGDESSDSDCYYEDPSSAETTNNEEAAQNGDDANKSLYCISFRKKKGPLADYLQIFKEFRDNCYRLNNAERSESTAVPT